MNFANKVIVNVEWTEPYAMMNKPIKLCFSQTPWQCPALLSKNKVAAPTKKLGKRNCTSGQLAAKQKQTRDGRDDVALV